MTHIILLFTLILGSIVLGLSSYKARAQNSNTFLNAGIKKISFMLFLAYFIYAGVNIYKGLKVFNAGFEYAYFCTTLLCILFPFLNLSIKYRIGKICAAIACLFGCLGGALMALNTPYISNQYENLTQELIWLIHMSSNLTGSVFLSMSLILGINYIRNQSLIKHHDTFDALDEAALSLSAIDRMMSKLLYVVFIVINISLFTGIALAHSLWDSAWLTNPKFIASALMWLMFAVLVWGRLKKGWRGKTFVQGLLLCEITLIGLLLLSFIK